MIHFFHFKNKHMHQFLQGDLSASAPNTFHFEMIVLIISFLCQSNSYNTHCNQKTSSYNDNFLILFESFGTPTCIYMSMVAYFCHHLSENYVDLSDLYVVLSDLYVDL